MGKLISLGLGGLGGIIASLLVLAVYFVGTATAKGADGGDWLSFAGVIFAVFGTIAGTLAIEELRQWLVHRRAVKNLLRALGTWAETVEKAQADLNKAIISDLRQQQSFISAISGDLRRSAYADIQAAHTFATHVPSMLNTLGSEIDAYNAGGVQALVGHYTLASLADYGTVLQQVLLRPERD